MELIDRNLYTVEVSNTTAADPDVPDRGGALTKPAKPLIAPSSVGFIRLLPPQRPSWSPLLMAEGIVYAVISAP